MGRMVDVKRADVNAGVRAWFGISVIPIMTIRGTIRNASFAILGQTSPQRTRSGEGWY
jgi:hypothetical protein